MAALTPGRWYAAPVGSALTELELVRLHAHVASLAHELQWLERVLSDSSRLDALLAGRCFVYVGGRPGSNAVLRERVTRASGVFEHHVALIDDDGSARARDFAALLRRADIVLCPLDTIDTESLAALRSLCARNGVPWAPLRSSNVASFAAGVLRSARRLARSASYRMAD